MQGRKAPNSPTFLPYLCKGAKAVFQHLAFLTCPKAFLTESHQLIAAFFSPFNAYKLTGGGMLLKFFRFLAHSPHTSLLGAEWCPILSDFCGFLCIQANWRRNAAQTFQIFGPFPSYKLTGSKMLAKYAPIALISLLYGLPPAHSKLKALLLIVCLDVRSSG